MQVDNSWASIVSSNIPSGKKICKHVKRKGLPIVNEYELHKEVMYNKRLPDKDDNGDINESKRSYDKILKHCQTGHFQGTSDEDLYYKVVTSVNRVIKGRVLVSGRGKGKRSVKEPDKHVLETKKMFFKDFFQYLEYLSFKNGPRPRVEFFSSEESFERAYASWENRSKNNIPMINGSNWSKYRKDNNDVNHYFSTRKEEEEYRREYIQNRQEELQEMNKVTHENRYNFNSEYKEPYSNRTVSPERPRLFI